MQQSVEQKRRRRLYVWTVFAVLLVLILLLLLYLRWWFRFGAQTGDTFSRAQQGGVGDAVQYSQSLSPEEIEALVAQYVAEHVDQYHQDAEIREIISSELELYSEQELVRSQEIIRELLVESSEVRESLTEVLTETLVTDPTVIPEFLAYENLVENGHINQTGSGSLLTRGTLDGLYLPLSTSIADLSDVDTSGIAVDKVLKWNGTAWVMADDVDTDTDTDTNTTYTAGSGLSLSGTQFLLGGTLSESRSIDLDGYNFIFTDLGSVAIGPTSPTAMLDIGGASTAQASLRIRSGTAPTSPNPGDVYSDGGTLYFYNGTSWLDISTPSTGTWSTSGSDVYYLAGNVGIGTSNPGYPLDVTGSARISGSLFAAGLQAGTDDSVLVLNASGEVVLDEIDPRVWGTSLLDVSDIGTSIQAYDDDLAALASLIPGDGYFIVGDGSNWVAESGGTVRTSLGLGTGDYPTFAGLTLTSLSDGVVKVSSGILSGGNSISLASEVAGILPLGSGGTSKALTASEGSVVYSDADSLEMSSVGTSGYLLASGGIGAPTWVDPTTLSGSGWWSNTANALVPKNEYASVVDLLLGGDSTSSAQVRLTSDGSAFFTGNVGVGSTSAGYGLDVIGTSRFGGEVKLDTLPVGTTAVVLSVNGSTGVIEQRDTTSWDLDASNDLTTSTSWSGDLSGTGASPTVVGLNGVPLGTTTAGAGNILVGDGSQWVTRPLDGDASLDGTGTLTLTTSGVVAGTYGSDTLIPVVTVDAKGRVTNIATSAASYDNYLYWTVQDDDADTNQITRLETLQLLGGPGISTNISAIDQLTITNTGVLSLTGTTNQVSVSASTGAITISLEQDIATTSSPTFAGLTLTGLSDGLVRSTSGVLSGGAMVNLSTEVTGVLALANGGTGKNISASAGSIIYSDADSFENSSVGSAGYLLASGGTGAPIWVDPTTLSGSGWWANNQNAMYVKNEYASVADLLVGGNATASASFRVTGLGNGSTNLSGYVYGRRFIDIDSTNYYIEPGNTTTAAVFAGNLGIGSTSPTVALDVDGSGALTGGLSVGSVPSSTSSAALVWNAVTGALEQRDTTGWDTNASNDLTTSTSWSGDLSGTGASPTVVGLNGVPLGTTTAGAGNILVGDGSQWVTRPLDGDASLDGTGTLTLTNSGVVAGTYGSDILIPVVTVDAKGRITTITTQSISADDYQFWTISDDDSDTDNLTAQDTLRIIGGSGISTNLTAEDELTITNTGVLSLAGTSNQVSVSAGTGDIIISLEQDIAASSSPTFSGLTLSGLSDGILRVSSGVLSGGGTVNVGTEVTGLLALANGGTGKSISASAGSIIYSDADSFETSSVGSAGYLLASGGTGAPTWVDPTTLSGSGWWANNLNALVPKNEYASVVDLLLGGSSTASATVRLAANGDGYFAGNVGIGTTSLSEKLQVGGTVLIPNDSLFAARNGADTGNVQLLRLTPSNQLAIGQNSVITDAFIYGGGSTRFYFSGSEALRFASNYVRPAINDTVSLGQETLRWADVYSVDGFFSGNVGIGTTTPDFALQVNGTIAPETTDQDLGTTALRWDVFANTINADSTLTFTGVAAGTDNTVLLLNSSNEVIQDEVDPKVWGTDLVDATTGTTNYLPKWTSGGETLGDSVVYDDGTNVGVGTATASAKLTVAGTTLSNAFEIRDPDGATSDYNFFNFDSDASGLLIQANSSGTPATQKRAITLSGRQSGSITIQNNPVTFANVTTLNVAPTSSFQATTGSYGRIAYFGGTFAPTSGTVQWEGVSVAPTINQSGGASGISRGLYVNPTLTAAADFRGIELANTSGYGVYQSSLTATNYFAGNVGIGSTSPVRQLDVTGTIIGDSFWVADGSRTISTDGGRMRVYANAGIVLSTWNSGFVDGLVVAPTTGYVGIGTASPDYELQVNGTIAPEVTDQDLGTTALRWDIFANTINADSTLTFTGVAAGTDNTVLVLNASNEVIQDEIDSRVWGTTLVDSAGTGVLNYVARFSDTNSVTIGTLFDTGTNVGIGTDTPSSRLDIYNTASADTTVEIQGTNSGYATGVSLQSGVGANWKILTQETYLDNALLFGTGAPYQMVLNTEGNLGIGSTSPTEKIDVGGTVRATTFTDGTATLTTGDLTGVADITASGVITFSGLSDGLVRATSGVLSGGNSADLVTETTGILPLSKGGTAQSITASAGSIIYSDADSFETSSVGSSGFLLASGGTGAPTWVDPATLSGSGWWTAPNNALYPKNEYAEVVDLLVGGSSTASADFRVTGAGNGSSNLAGYTYARRFIDVDSTSYYVEPGNTTVSAVFAGNVGVGTTNPSSRLTVQGTDAALTLSNDTLNSGNLSLLFRHYNTGSSKVGIISEAFGSWSLGSLDFAVNGASDGTAVSVADSKLNISSAGTKAIGGFGINATPVNNEARFSPVSGDTSFNLRLGTAFNSGTALYSFNHAQNISKAAIISQAQGSYSRSTGIRFAINDVSDSSQVSASDTKVIILPSGNVGIGTTTPDYELQVNGTIAPEVTDQDLGTTALRWDIYANTINADNTLTFTGIAAGTDNTVLILNASNQVVQDEIDPKVWGTGLVDASSGTTNYLTKWTTGGETLGDSVVYDDGTNVGVGTTNPSLGKVHVALPTGDQTGLYINGGTVNRVSFGGSGTAIIGISGVANFFQMNTGGDAYLYSGNNGDIHLDPHGTGDVIVDSGNVGIGTTTPIYKLDIAETANTVGVRVASNTAGDTLFYGSGTVTGSINIFGNNVSATNSVVGSLRNTNSSSGTANAALSLETSGANGGDPVVVYSVTGVQAWQSGVDNSDSDKFKINSNSSFSSNNRLTIDLNGNVGIGTTGPVSRLQVAGQGTTYADKLFRVDNSAAGRIITTTGDGRTYFGTDNGNDSVVNINLQGTKTTGNLLTLSNGSSVAYLNDTSFWTNNSTLGVGANTQGSALYFNSPINNTLNIVGSNVGIGTTTVPRLLTVNGAMRLNTTTTPASPAAGDIYSDGTNVYYYNGATWDDLTQASAIETWWTEGAKVIYPKEEYAEVADLVVGGSSTASADFRVTGLGNGSTDLAGYTYGRRFLDVDSTGYYVEPGNTTTAAVFAGNVGIGTTASGAKLLIDSSLDSFPSLQTKTKQGQRVFSYLKEDGTNLWYGQYDTSNFHTYLNDRSLWFNMNGNSVRFDGGGNSSSSVSISGSAKFVLNSPPEGGVNLIAINDGGYATASSQLTTVRAMKIGTWAWNGTNGYSIGSRVYLNQTQLSATNNDARFDIADTNNVSLLSILTSSGNVGIGTTSPDYELQVDGTIAPETTDQDLGTTALRWDVFANTINADSTLTFTGVAAGTDNTVLVLNSSNEVTQDEIDPRVWGTTLVDASGGIANYVARFSDGDSVTTGELYDNGTSVGVGTTDPSAKLDVVGNVELQNYLYFGNSTTEYIQWDGLNFIVTDDVLPATTNAQDLGSTAAEWRNAYLSGTLDFGTNTITDGILAGDWNFSSGNLSSIANLSASGTITFSGLSDGIVKAASGVLSGGNSVNLATEVSGVLALANGGTAKNITASAGSIVYSDADSFELSGVGTNGYLLASGGTGAPTWIDPTTLAGSVTWWGNTNNALHPVNEYAAVADVLVGGSSTASASIRLASSGLATFAGNVGVGTTTPDFELQVNGTIAPETSDQDLGTTSLRWDLFANTINADSTITFTGVSASTDNTVLLLNASNQVVQDEIDPKVWTTNLVDASSGTTNYLTKWSSGGETLANSQIFDNGTNVGIGTTTLSALLDVYKDQNTDTRIEITNPNAGIAARSILSLYNATNEGGHILVAGTGYTGVSSWQDAMVLSTDSFLSGGLKLRASTGGIKLSASATEADDFFVAGTGNVGIGTTAPGVLLQLGNYTKTSSSDISLITEANYDSTLKFTEESANYGWDINYDGDSSNDLYFVRHENSASGSIAVSFQRNTGFVGIGTSSPGSELDIASTQPNIRLHNTETALNDFGKVYSSLEFYSDDPDHASLPGVQAYIQAEHTRAGTGHTFADAGLTFGTLSNAGSVTERMRIQHNGVVGIGTTTPVGNFELYNTGDTTFVITADGDNVGENDNPRLELRQDGNAVIGALGYIGDAGQIYTGSTVNSMYLVNDYASELFFGTNASIDMTLTSAGNLGIGTTTAPRLLTVDGAMRLNTTTTPGTPAVGDIYSNGTNLYYYNGSGWDDLTAGAGSSLWTQSGSDIYYNSGNVSIGTSTAISGLTIFGQDLTMIGNNKDFDFFEFGSNAGDKGDMDFYRARGSYGAETIVQNGDQLGSLRFSAYDGFGYHYVAQVRAEIDGTPGNNDLPTRLEFYTTSDNANGFERRWYIDSSGDFLAQQYGDSSGTKADINFIKGRGTAGAPTAAINGDEIGTLRFTPFDGSNWNVGAQIKAVVDGTLGTNDIPTRLDFLTVPDGSNSLSTRMTIANSGNVGIGTTVPTSQLTLASGGLEIFTDNYGVGFFNESPYGADASTGLDAARIYFNSSVTVAGATNDYFVIEKTDGNTAAPDGGVAFLATGSDDIQSVSFAIKADGDLYAPNLANATGTAMYYNTSNGRISYSSSSQRYKQNIGDLEQVNWLYELNPVEFEYKTEPGTTYMGLIAEQVEQVNPKLVFYKNNQVEGVHYDRLATPLLLATQQHQMRLNALEKNAIEFSDAGTLEISEAAQGVYTVTFTDPATSDVTPVQGRLGAVQGFVADLTSGVSKSTELVVSRVASISDLSVNSLKVSGTSIQDMIRSIARQEAQQEIAQQVLVGEDELLVATASAVTQDELVTTLDTYVTQDEMINQVGRTDFFANMTWTADVLTIMKQLVVKAAAVFEGPVTFLREVTFRGEIRVNQDTAGSVTVPAGVTKLRVRFEQPFSKVPVVYITNQESPDIRYGAEQVSTTDFILTLSGPHITPVRLNWLALVRESDAGIQTEILETQEYVSGNETTSATTVTEPTQELAPAEPSPEPAVVPAQEPSGIVAGEATDSGTLLGDILLEGSQATPSAQSN